MKTTKYHNGYSLLETTMALSIVALLVLIGSSFNLNPGKHQLEVAVRKIHSSLSLARFRSIHRQVPVKVSFEENFCLMAEFDSQNAQWITKSREFLEGVKISATNAPIFYPQGTVSNLATIKISNSRGLYQITVAITGRIKSSRIE
ncbi:MAG: GspH/FimT family protein [Acidobacteriota bacterium]|nr:GspH/FimT family protein [Acidobacteriota bacterium]MDW3229850.1 GspH/FimT family protein [Acidobacteriota bacterium]MDY0232021.1 GspH/FimT family protein [Candidatus Saccharicenans sp.]